MKQVLKKGARNKVGAMGELLAIKHLVGNGHSILDTNYLKKWGEIDIISKLGHTVHFVEVKTVSHGTKEELEEYVTRETHRPEENAHPDKIRKVARTAETWIMENKWTGDWQIDVAAVRIVPEEKYATIKLLDNVILE